MKTHRLLALILPTLLSLAGCNKGAPLPGGYAIFIASSEEILLVDKQSGGVAGANLVQIGNLGVLIFGEIQLMPRRPAKDSDTPGFFILDSTTGAIENGLFPRRLADEVEENRSSRRTRAGQSGKVSPPQMMHRLGTTLFLAVLLAAHLVHADDALVMQELIAKATQGDTQAQVSLAVRYRDGKGVAKDEAEAMQRAHRAADKGNADAVDFVGHAYLRGAVVKRSPEIAFGYFKAAAEKSAQAAFNLGQCYYGARAKAVLSRPAFVIEQP